MAHIDTHIDVLCDIKKSMRSFRHRSDKDHVDLPRACEGGLLAGFFAIFPTKNQYYIEEGVRRWLQLVEDPENQLENIRRTYDLENL